MYPPSKGRLNGLLAWCANEDKKGEEYLQIHLPEAETICAIATQGTGYKNGNEHVTFYFLEYSKDGQHWKFIEEDRNPKVSVFNSESWVVLLEAYQRPGKPHLSQRKLTNTELVSQSYIIS